MEEKRLCDYYEFLGVNINASEKDIYNAWKQLRTIYSPSNVDSQKHFTIDELNDLEKLTEEAYGILAHPLKRATYNELLYRRMPGKYSPSVSIQSVSGETRQKIQQMPEFDGSLIRQIRESSSCSIEELSQITKIKTCYLEAIEDNRLDDLPAPVFVRGYIIQISKALGLDAENASQSYMNYFNEQRP